MTFSDSTLRLPFCDEQLQIRLIVGHPLLVTIPTETALAKCLSPTAHAHYCKCCCGEVDNDRVEVGVQLQGHMAGSIGLKQEDIVGLHERSEMGKRWGNSFLCLNACIEDALCTLSPIAENSVIGEIGVATIGSMGWKLELCGCRDQYPLALACVISGELYQAWFILRSCDAMKSV